MNIRFNADNSIRRDHNAGFSMVELVTVLGIMAVLMVVGLSWYGLIPSTQVKGCSENLELAFDKARTNALSYQDTYLDIYCTSEGVFTDCWVKKGMNWTCTTEQVGKAGVTIAYLISNESDYQTLPATDGTTTRLRIRYIRTTGGFTYCQLMKRTDDGTETTTQSYSTDSYCSDIRISKGNTERTLHFVKLTGKVED